MTVLENGAIVVDRGSIVDVGQRGNVIRSNGDRLVNLGSLLLMPGMINAHTHLEEGVARGTVDPFQTDLTGLAADRQRAVAEASGEAIATAVHLGIRESISSGITTIADTWTRSETVPAYGNEKARIVPFRQYNPPSLAEEYALIAAMSGGTEARAAGSGISPYALWSFTADHHRDIARYTAANNLLWACHMAETPDELLAFGEHSGSRYDAVCAQRVWSFEAGRDPVLTAIAENIIPRGALLHHCSYADGNALSLLATKGASVVICPQYAELLSLREFPLETALSRNINVCLGTEAPIGPYPINLFDALYSIRCENPQIPAGELLRCVTINPAHALRLHTKIGTLEPGKLADIIGLRVPHDKGADVLEELLISQPCVDLVVIAGEEILTRY